MQPRTYAYGPRSVPPQSVEASQGGVQAANVFGGAAVSTAAPMAPPRAPYGTRYSSGGASAAVTNGRFVSLNIPVSGDRIVDEVTVKITYLPATASNPAGAAAASAPPPAAAVSSVPSFVAACQPPAIPSTPAPPPHTPAAQAPAAVGVPPPGPPKRVRFVSRTAAAAAARPPIPVLHLEEPATEVDDGADGGDAGGDDGTVAVLP